jgi:hypothetical protein
VFAGFVNRDNARVLQPRGGFGFCAEAQDLLMAGKLAGQNHFYGDNPIQTNLPRAINDAHSAARNLFQELVIADSARLK